MGTTPLTGGKSADEHAARIPAAESQTDGSDDDVDGDGDVVDEGVGQTLRE